MLDWHELLSQWSKDLSATDLAKGIVPPPASPDWLGFPPATDDEIADLENRLGLALPPSYKAFLKVSNGWRMTNCFISCVRPASRVDWFRVENETWVEIFSEQGDDREDAKHFQYTIHGAEYHRAEDMKFLLQISDVGDGVYLLNPEAVTPDGEWEAWFFANWIPGASRYPSFAHLMIAEYHSFARMERIDSPAGTFPFPDIPGPQIPRVRANRNREQPSRALTLEALIVKMGSPSANERDAAVRAFAGKLKGRPRADRRPDLVSPICDLYYSSPDPSVRSVCVAALTEIAEDDVSPKPLFDALMDEHPWVILSGISALNYFPNPQALGPLCRFIESSANALFYGNAMHALAEIGDPRAVPTLSGVLLDARTPLTQNFSIAAQALARCRTSGFDALVAAMGNEDGRIRRAVVVGLDCSNDPRARGLLDQMESDPDPDVRKRVKQCSRTRP